TVDSCRIKARQSTSASASASLLYAHATNTNFFGDSIVITNNHFLAGGNAIYLYGSGPRPINAIIDNNFLEDFGGYGAYFYEASSIKFRNNTLRGNDTASASTGYGLY